jgi:hypothetical protein
MLLCEISKTQAGFRRDSGTRNQVLNLKLIAGKAYEYNTPLFCCFIDYSKAFDCVDFSKLWTSMLTLGVPRYLVSTLASLYEGQRALIETPVGRSNALCIGRGVRQGCPMSPTLFNLYSEVIMRQALDGWKGGFCVGGQKISDLRYADDVVLIATSEEQLQQLVDRVATVSAAFGLRLNSKKTEVMVFARTPVQANVQHHGEPLKQVTDFTYLGCVFNSNNDQAKEIRRRITLAKSAAGKLGDIWKGKSIPLDLKRSLMEMMIWSIMSYGSETWIYNKDVLRKILTFETWCYRRILRISWTERVTNEEVYRRIGSQPKLSTQLLQRRLGFFGHTVRKDGLTLQLIEGRVNGKRPRGRPRTTWLKDICYHTKLTTTQLMQAARNRRIGNPT